MITLNPETYEIIATDALHSFPNECCGFFYGEEENENRFVYTARVVNNAKPGDKKRRFEISARDYMLAEQYAAENKLTLLGIYHSHPLHPAIPSEHDRLAALPWFSYIIVSVSPGRIEQTLSWRLNGQQVFEPDFASFIHKKIKQKLWLPLLFPPR
jgi:proteasome lid subunit RPN8/RPN11